MGGACPNPLPQTHPGGVQCAAPPKVQHAHGCNCVTATCHLRALCSLGPGAFSPTQASQAPGGVSGCPTDPRGGVRGGGVYPRHYAPCCLPTTDKSRRPKGIWQALPAGQYQLAHTHPLSRVLPSRQPPWMMRKLLTPGTRAPPLCCCCEAPRWGHPSIPSPFHGHRRAARAWARRGAAGSSPPPMLDQVDQVDQVDQGARLLGRRLGALQQGRSQTPSRGLSSLNSTAVRRTACSRESGGGRGAATNCQGRGMASRSRSVPRVAAAGEELAGVSRRVKMGGS